MSISEVPVTIQFDKDPSKQIGRLLLDIGKLPKWINDIDWSLEPAFKILEMNDDGVITKAELLEVSLIPRFRKYIPCK